MVQISFRNVPNNEDGGVVARAEKGGIRSIPVCAGGSGLFFHLHDDRGRGWEEGRAEEVPRRLRSCAQGQFHGLADGADY